MTAWRTLGVAVGLVLDFSVCLLLFGTLFNATVVFLLSVAVQYAYMNATSKPTHEVTNAP